LKKSLDVIENTGPSEIKRPKEAGTVNMHLTQIS
jgi:hypothetical protein